MTIDQVIGRLERVKKNGTGWMARCPAHEDHNPSLHVSEGSEGRIILKCFAGCTAENIVAALGLAMSDLFAEPDTPDEPEAIYVYEDENGQPLHRTVRKARRRGEKKGFYQQHWNGRSWADGNQGRRVLYHLPAVLAAAAFGETVYIVEGEKDVHAAERAGAVATTNPMGAGKWRSEYATYLEGAEVIIVADIDANGTGQAHARRVAETLPAHSTRLMRPATGKDISDHLAEGLTLDQLLPLDEPDSEKATENPIVFETLRAFLARDLPKAESLIGTARNGTNLLPRYGWVMPWGREGSGKTSVLVDLIFHATNGRQWNHYPVLRPLKFVLVINEGVPGGLQDKLRQKIDVWDGDTDQVLDNIAIYASPWGEFTFKNERMVAHCRDYCRDFQADYAAFDPLHTLGTIGAGTPQETEQFKHGLRDFGVWDWIGAITAHHSNKNGMVSGDWARHPDTVIHLEKDGKRPATLLTLEKARPADPEEIGVPQILEWNTETLGYTCVRPENAQRVSDNEILESVLDQLLKLTEPIGMTNLQLLVGGDTKRVSHVTKRAIQDGRITNKPRKHGTYLLSLPNVGETRPTDVTDDSRRSAQTRMATNKDVGDVESPTTASEGEKPTERRDVGGDPLTPGGGHRHRRTDVGADHHPDDDIPF